MPASSDGRSSAPPLVSLPTGVDLPLDEAAEGRADPRVPLRLAVTRGALGLELYEPVELGPLTVTRLTLTLPGLKFPLDLSGGVPVFRNRRGDLERLELALSLDALARYCKPRLEEIIGPLVRPVACWIRPPALSFGIVAGDAALAFDCLWAPFDQSARFVVSNARGAGLAGPALGYALRAVEALFGRVAKRSGRVFEIDNVGMRVGRALLPAVGARAPAAARVRFGDVKARGDEVHVELDSSFTVPGLTNEVISALELALLVTSADDAVCNGDVHRARQSYLGALEQAPRHPELSRMVAEIDAAEGNRPEAALGMLAEAQPVLHAGSAGVELLAAIGDRSGAREAAAEMARVESYGPLAALLWLTAAKLDESVHGRLLALDHAVARAPALASVRAARLSARLEQRDVEGALADAQHLEASATGARARHEACKSAARQLLEAGFVSDAGKLFERALRYVPSDAAATAGLGRAFVELGKPERAVALLERAVMLGEKEGRADPDALLDLAQLLANSLKDLPQAIARVRQIPVAAAQAIRARGLEARWRASLGDIVGASLAYSRTRETIELRRDASKESLEFLTEAAVFERDTVRDPVQAERHLTVALKLAPRDEAVLAAYRDAAALLLLHVKQRSGG